MTTDPHLVLLVESDPGFLESARATLADHRIITAGNLTEALEIVAGGRVDLVLLGPGCASDASIEAATGLTDVDPTVAVVLVAEIVTNRTLRAALRAGFADVVDSPLDFESIRGFLAGPVAGDRPEVMVVIEEAEAHAAESVRDQAPTEENELPPADPFATETEEGPQTSFDSEPAAIRSSSETEPPMPPVAPPHPSVAAPIAPSPVPRTEPTETPATSARDEPADAGAESDDAEVEPELALERLIPQLPAQGPGDIFLPVASDDHPRGSGRVIAVMTGKGGSGKTVVATNLAVAMAQRRDPEQVVIVDGDLQFGDVALMLQIEPVRTLDDVAGRTGEMSDAQLESALIRHESSIKVLPAPLLPVRADEITSKHLVEIVDRLRMMYEVVVVDTGPVFDDGLVTVLESADDIVAVVDMDLASVKNAKVVLDGLRTAGFPMERITMVVNRINSKARLDLVELERSLRLRVGGSVPSDRLVPQSVNDGVPATLLSPRSRVARAFHALAETLDPEARRERLTAG